jgi:hypothetical protein
MQYRELVIPQKHANVIWWAAWLSLGATWHAVYIQQPGFGIVPTCVLCTSLNYWRNPVRTSWRRTIDMSTVFVGLCYQTTLAYNMPDALYRDLYFSCIAASSACYAFGHLFMALNMPRASAYAHAGIHVVANMGNIALQRGAKALI